MSLPRSRRAWILTILLLGALMLLVAACVPATTTGPGASPGASVPATPRPTPLVIAQPGADPVSLLAWLFTPIFQALFILLVGLYDVFGDIGVAIVVMTLVVRVLLVPVFRRQIVSQRRMQLLQPEINEIRKRYRGDRSKVSEQQMQLYKERGVNPLQGCLPTILTMFLLIPMYSVIRDGLTNYDPSALLKVFGTQVVPLHCSNVVNGTVDIAKPCINTVIWWLGNLDVGKPEITLTIVGFGLSLLAVASALLQLVQTRMVMPQATGSDSSARMQQQTFLLLPLFSILYGGILPAGLFIYWIVTTVFSVVQQYLIVGWGSLFPVRGWTPGFAQNHTPRFPVALPSAPPRSSGSGPAKPTPSRTATDRAASAASTVRPRERSGRTSRRGRRR